MNENNSEIEILIEKREKLQQELDNMIRAYEGIDDREIDPEDEYKSSPQYIMYEIESEIGTLDSKIGEIYYKQEKELYKQEYDKKMVNYYRGSVLSDLMNTEDLFNRRERAKILAQYIIDKTTHTPFNIGIFAQWGKGKTTFLNYLKEELELYNSNKKDKNNENFETYVVNYDASEYEEKDKIWASIMRAMYLKYENDTWFPKLFYNLKKILHDKKKFRTHILSYILSLMIVCALSVYSINALWSDWDKEWKIITGTGTTIIAIIIMIAKLIIPVAKGLLQSALPLSDKIVNNISLPNYVDKLGQRENIKKDLSILTDAWLRRWKKANKRLVLIIDELDRCSEKGIVEFFQSMQLFLKVPQVVIIFAIDQEYLKKALSNSFKITGKEEANEFLLEYLDKYINMPISLDIPENYLTYIDNLLSNVTKNESNFAFSDGEKQAIKSTFESIPTFLLTPRKVKKLVNLLIISKETCVLFNKNSKDMELVDFRGYISWFLFSYFYKDAAKNIFIYSKQYDKYLKIKHLLNKISKDQKEKLLININNIQIIKLIDEIVIKDIYNYENILSGFTKII